MSTDNTSDVIGAVDMRTGAQALEAIHIEEPSHIVLTSIGEIMRRLRLQARNPTTVRMEVAVGELRIKVSNEVVLRASKPNGADAWTVMADHQIRKMVHPDLGDLNY